MAAPLAYAAVDLGASSARLFGGHLEQGRLVVEEVARVRNGPVQLPDGIHSDVAGLHQGMLEGLARLVAKADGRPIRVGIDSWGVDYGLLDADGHLLGLPFHYRDARTLGMGEEVSRVLGPGRLYEMTGIQQMEINTVFQLMAEKASRAYEAAATLLLVPDLLGYFLTGHKQMELTNASTTQFVDCRTGAPVPELFEALGLRSGLLAPLARPGEVLGPVLKEVAGSVAISSPLEVVTVASHDTASAVLAVPAAAPDFAYVISGTWSLVGLELDRPVVSEESRRANFSNELGADGTVTFLRNVMGHWMLQECQRQWGHTVELSHLLAEARLSPPFASIVDTADPLFARPGDMPARTRAACAATGQPVPESEAQLVRCIVDSMALAIADALEDAQRLAGRQVDVVHLLGGGVSNDLLLDLVAAAAGRDVLAGPVEASAIGNLLVQLRAAGQAGDRAEARQIVARSFPVKRVRPDAALARQAQAARRRLAGAVPSGDG